MSVRFEEAGEVGGEKEEEGNVGEEEEEEKEEDNVGEVGEARWGMSFLSLHLLLRLHHSRSTKLFGTLLTLSSWRTVSQLLALHIFYSLHNLGSYWHCPVSNVPIAETQKVKNLIRRVSKRDCWLWGLNCRDTYIWQELNMMWCRLVAIIRASVDRGRDPETRT